MEVKRSEVHSIKCLFEQVPTLPWNEVLNELDHPEFVLKDRNGLNLLMSAIRLGIQAHGFHPDMVTIDFLYRRWKNSDGQVATALSLPFDSTE